MARAGRVFDNQATRWLDDLLRATYLGISLQDPFSVADPLTVEVATARAPVTWVRSARLNRNAALLAWTGIPVGTNAWGLVGWTAGTNGEAVFAFPMALSLPSGGGFSL